MKEKKVSMYMKKPLSIGFVALLLLSMVMVMAAPVTAKPAPPDEASIWVEPDFVNGCLVGLGNTFLLEVEINVSDTCGDPLNPGIYAFAFKLSWNNTLINVTSYETYAPSDGAWEDGYDAVDRFDVEDDTTTHVFGASARGVPAAFSGNMTVAEYNFTVLDEPPVVVSSDLHLSDCVFIDSLEGSFDATAYDGEYVIPEFPVALIAPLFIVATLVAVILRKRRISFVAK